MTLDHQHAATDADAKPKAALHHAPPITEENLAHGLAVVSIGKSYDKRVVLKDISLSVDKGEVLGLLGPNGGGKTTLFRTLLGVLPPLAGEVRVADRPLADWSRQALAQTIAYVPQAHAGLFAFSVEEIVLMGRTARLGRFSTPARTDRVVAARVLEQLGIAHLAGRIYTEIFWAERIFTWNCSIILSKNRLW